MDPASVVVVRPSVRSHFQTSSPLKPLGQSKPNFMFKFYYSWEGGTKVCINGPGHMPIYGKNLKKSSSPEPAGRFPRNLVYIASGTPVHHSLYK